MCESIRGYVQTLRRSPTVDVTAPAPYSGDSMHKYWRTALFLVTALLLALLPAATASAQGIVIASDNFNRANESPFGVTGNWGRVVAGNYDGVSALTGNQV